MNLTKQCRRAAVGACCLKLLEFDQWKTLIRLMVPRKAEQSLLVVPAYDMVCVCVLSVDIEEN